MSSECWHLYCFRFPCFDCSLVAGDEGNKLVKFDAARVIGVDDFEEGVDVLTLNANLKLGNQVGNFVDGEVSALVQVEVVENLFEEVGVLAGKIPHATLHLS